MKVSKTKSHRINVALTEKEAGFLLGILDLVDHGSKKVVAVFAEKLFQSISAQAGYVGDPSCVPIFNWFSHPQIKGKLGRYPGE